MAEKYDYKLPLSIEDIQKYIPHRYPFLLVDRVDIIEPGERIVGIKNVSINEGFFQGHFPNRPVMPGVLLLECMAQLGGLYVNILGEAAENTLVVFTGINDVKFRRQVVPGDTLRIELSDYRRKMIHFKMKGEVYVGDELACSASVSAAMVPWKQ